MAYRYRGTVHDLNEPIRTIYPARKPPQQRKDAGTGCGVAIGTPAGYKRHQKANENACDPCKEALAEYSRDYRAKIRSGERFVRKGFTPDRCGTYAGYIHHGRQDVPACKPCLKAYREYMADYRANRKQQAA